MPFADGVIRILETQLKSGIDITHAQGELFQLLCRESLPVVPSALRSSVRIVQKRPIRFSWIVVMEGRGWVPEQNAGIYEVVGKCAGVQAIDQKVPFVVQADIKTNPYCQDDREILPDARSHTSLPILSRRLKGVLSIDSSIEEVFTRAVLDQLEYMTTKAAWVLDHLAQQEASWLLDLEREISRNENVETLCRTALDRTVKMFGVQGGGVFLWDPAEELLKCAATLPRAGEVRQVPKYWLGEGLTGWVAQSRQILRLRDVENEDELQRIDPRLKWANQYSELADPRDVSGRRTFLAAPLLVQKELIGVIRLTVKQNYADFTENDDSLIESLAATLALAIQNIQNQERSRRRQMQLEIFDKLGAAATDIPSIARVILENGLQIVNSDEGHIRFYDGEKKTLRMSYSVGTYTRLLDEERKLGSGISGRVAESRQPLVFKDITTDPEFQRILAEEQTFLLNISKSKIRSSACYPLVSGTELVGTLSFHWREEKRFGADERVRLAALVSRGALALGAALAFRERDGELERYRSALERLRRLGMEFTHQPDIDKLFEMCLRAAIVETGITSGIVRTLNAGLDAWVLRTAIEDDPQYPGVECLQDNLPAHLRLLREASSKREATKIFDTDHDVAFLEFKGYFRPHNYCNWAYLDTVKSMLIAPMWIGDICKGLIFLCSHTPHDLSERNATYLEILAAEAAIAIHNAELLADTQGLLDVARPLAMIGVAYGGFQHVLGSSIEVMLSIADTMKHPNFPPARLPKKVDELRAVLERLTRYRTDVIEFLQSAHTAIQEEIDVNRAVGRALEEHSQKRAGVSLDLNLASDLPQTVGNYLSIQQAFSMLIGNALDALHGTGKLRISTGLSQNGIRIRFEDTGDGMDAATRKRAGEVFFSTKGAKGTGLGLAMVKSVVGRHRGKWEIVSSAPGEGTTIDVYLPPVEQANHATPVTS
jgi:GAF domain-containing protein